MASLSCIFLATIFLSISVDRSTALVHRIPLHSTGSLRTRLLQCGAWRRHVERTRNDLSVTEDSRREFYRGFYVANITLGTPPQQLLVALDTGFPYFWVIDSRCTSEACVGDTISNHSKAKFNANASSTLHGKGNAISLPCVNCGRGVEGDEHVQLEATRGHYHQDRLMIGPLHFDNQAFLLANYVDEQWASYPVDGVMGLAWPSRTVLGQRPALINMLDQLDQPVFTFWVDWRRPPSLGGAGGFVTFGGPDNDHCVGPWTSVALGARSTWQFPIHGFKVGRFRSFRTKVAMADTGTAMIGGPYPQINMIIEATHAEFSQEDDLFTVPCSAIPNLPPFILTINGTDVAIPASEYVLDLELPGGKCALGVFGMYSNGYTADWVLGDIFFDSLCTMFDYGNGRLSFARAKDTIPYGDEPYNANLHMMPAEALNHAKN